MDERWRGVQHARPALDAFLDEEVSKSGIDEAAIALVGFSQGAMMALHAGIRRARRPAAIVAYSGLLVAPERQPPSVMKAEVTAKPPVLLVHGDKDEVIPPEALLFSGQGLASLDIPVEFHMSRGSVMPLIPTGCAWAATFCAAPSPDLPLPAGWACIGKRREGASALRHTRCQAS